MMKNLLHYSCLLVVVVCLASFVAEATKSTVADRYKAPNEETPAALAAEWEAKDKALLSYVEETIPVFLDHTGGDSFDSHLKGVQAVLRYWQAPEHVAMAGLFHSIYGTEAFQDFTIPLSQRPMIADLIGEKAEYMCFIFCMMDRTTLDYDMAQYLYNATTTPSSKHVFYARPELGRFAIEMDHEEWLDFMELNLADWLEQVEGAASLTLERFHWSQPGHAYAYRRTAFSQMAQILQRERGLNVAMQMWKEVYESEPMETRHLEQPRTPLMSEAAKEAIAALQSMGELPTSIVFDPQPQEACVQDQ